MDRTKVYVIEDNVRATDHNSCRLCGYPMDVHDPAIYVEIEGTFDQEGPLCDRDCANRYARKNSMKIQEDG